MREAVRLENIKEIECNIYLQTPDRDQLVYASQLYGTFFAVSACLKLSQDGKYLNSMTLSLINYKGLLNIGMLDETKTSWKFEAKTGMGSIVLFLKAMEGSHGHSKSIEVDCKNVELKNFKNLLVSRKLRPFGEHPTSKTAHLNESCFDEEFYDRDGAVIGESERLDDAKITIENNNKASFTTNSGRCQTTMSKIIH
ncbi:hypothetical protein [Maribacter hydrothermalis]|uniref:Uncharacterized protein n=1 Tax=Maribacter hydrothermalis TaxID=1836467 RepID=A0A1B7ZCD4_9FLAO|nr:hypothetical protein [Maribacter hydrothermalis]APQ18029.1 hypothetical protein BTR34_12115 [Maribacter hydrothermalis]OBR40571.1 hypothetical protein A9200_15775 [Maribacter hydrothermalis]